MQPVIVSRFGTGKCILTGKEDVEGVEAEFKDCGLRGFLAWGEFRKLLKARSDDATGQNPSIGTPSETEAR